MKFQMLTKTKMLKNKVFTIWCLGSGEVLYCINYRSLPSSFLACKLSDAIFIMLTNVKIQTIVEILTFMNIIIKYFHA